VANCFIAVWVNEDVNGDHVALALEGAEIIEWQDSQLVPMMEMSPAHAMRLAETLVECAGKIIQAAAEGPRVDQGDESDS
jgi:hypothetical protein